VTAGGQGGCTEGKLGGQEQVKGVDGTWKEPPRQRQFMAATPHVAVRGIGARRPGRRDTATSRDKMTLEARTANSEIADTINNMIEPNTLADLRTTGHARSPRVGV